MHDRALQNLRLLKELVITNCQLKWAPVISWVCETLEHLKLEHNDIFYLPKNYFKNCNRIKMIDFQWNALHYMPNLEPLRLNLVEFRGSYNKIRSCDSLCGFTYPKINHIGLIKYCI